MSDSYCCNAAGCCCCGGSYLLLVLELERWCDCGCDFDDNDSDAVNGEDRCLGGVFLWSVY